MSEPSRRPVEELRAEVASAFGGDLDPLAAYASTFEKLDIDPFELFRSEALAPEDLSPKTLVKYDRLFGQWQEVMAREGRHPACPSDYHVKAFVDYCIRVRGNQPDTARSKLFRMNKIFRYWQQDPVFPHTEAYNPFLLVLSTYDLSRPPTKKPPRLSISELADVIGRIKDVRDRTVVVAQLKLGLRGSELANLRIDELHIDDAEIRGGYPNLGTTSRLDGRPNAVYIPSRYERTGNKSRRPRVLPVDAELRKLLELYLLTRPDSGHPWVFQSKTSHTQLNAEGVNDIWTNAFHPAYAESERYRAVTSHYGRHRFTTYWTVEQEVNRELVKYMRGDRVEGELADREAVDDYTHTYYEDIEPIYRDRIFRVLS